MFHAQARLSRGIKTPIVCSISKRMNSFVTKPRLQRLCLCMEKPGSGPGRPKEMRERMKLHRINIGLAVALGGLLVLTSPGLAQNTNSTARPGRRGPNVQQRVERLSTELKLTDDQKTKVTALFEKEAKQGRELRDDTSLSREERRDKMRGMRQEQMKELKTILTSEQFDKFQQLRQEMRARQRGGPGQSGEAAPAPAPAPQPKNSDNKGQ